MAAQIRRGTLLAFDSTTWTATVMLDGADTETTIAVGQWVPSGMLVAAAEVAVLIFGAESTDTDDAVVLGAYGGLGALSTSPGLIIGDASGLGSAVGPDPGELYIHDLAKSSPRVTYTLYVLGADASGQTTSFARLARFNAGFTTTFVTGSEPAATAHVSINHGSLAGASAGAVIADAATLDIDGAPGPGANMTITRAMALWLHGGWSRHDGGLTVGGITTAPATGVINMTGALQKSGTQVVTARQTGWTAWTGTATRSSKATSTATLANVAEALKALIDDLIAHGLIGP